MTPTYESGTIAFDLAQMKPVVIIDPDIGTVSNLDNPKRELVTNAPGNRAIGFEYETRVAEVMYFNLQSENDTTYSFPHTRVGVPIMEVGDDDLSVREYLLQSFLTDVFAEAHREDAELFEELADLLSAMDEYDAVLSAAMDNVDENLDSFSSDS